MDAGYDAEAIREFSRGRGHVPIIDVCPRGGEQAEWEPALQRRHGERTTAERGFSMLKESFGCRSVRVRGGMEVKSDLLFGLLALAAVRKLNLLLRQGAKKPDNAERRGRGAPGRIGIEGERR
jgi:hypothetical protein